MTKLTRIDRNTLEAEMLDIRNNIESVKGVNLRKRLDKDLVNMKLCFMNDYFGTLEHWTKQVNDFKLRVEKGVK